MARTTREIFEAMVRDKESRAELAGLTSNSDVSVWRMLLWVVAGAIHVAEQLMDAFVADVKQELTMLTPHRADWYAYKATQYVEGKTLQPGKDVYDLSGMDEGEIARRRVVKYAAAVESSDMSVLYVKVAGEDDGGRRQPLSEESATQVAAYLDEVKDVGVRIKLINQPADQFQCVISVLYDPILSPESIQAAIERTVESYVEDLAFNGEYSNMALIDAVQKIEGVKIAEVRSAQVKVSDGVSKWVDMRYTPMAGYMEAEAVVVMMKPYSAYASV